MTPSLKSLLRASRFMALIGLLALSLTEDITGLWHQLTWLAFTFSLILDRHPFLQRPLRRWEPLGVAGLVSLTIADFLVFKNSLFIVVAHFLLVLQTLKLLGLKERKDCLQIGLVGFFQLLAACTLSADMWQAILLALLIPGATALFFWNYAARIQEEAFLKTPWPDRSLRRLHLGLSIAALPLNVALTVMVFVLFPRLTLNVRVPGFGAGQSAYTDQMNLAQTGSVGRDRSVAAWMGFSDDAQRSQWSHYLRGDVLDTFNGREWINTHQEKVHALAPDRNGVFKLRVAPAGKALLHAKLTLLNTTKNTLFTPGSPLEIVAPFPHLESTDAGDFHWTAPLQHPLQYDVVALADEREDSPADLTALPPAYGQVPTEGLERTKALSDKVGGAGTPLEKARALTNYLRTHYQYTLNFGTTIPGNPVDYFLFERRQGFCIHFASALAVMLRLENIPSRVVAGYYRGEWNPLAGQVLFREEDAHAWVEAWVNDHWITLDPSPRAALETAAPSRERLIWLHLRETWDYLGFKWQRFIIEYDLYSQLRAWEHLRSRSDRLSSRWLTLWKNLRREHPTQRVNARADEKSAQERPRHSLGKLTPLAWAPLIVFFIFGTRFLLQRARKSAVPYFYLRFLRRLKRLGFEKQRSETALEFARRAARRLPKEAVHIEEITSAYYRLRFGKK